MRWTARRALPPVVAVVWGLVAPPPAAVGGLDDELPAAIEAVVDEITGAIDAYREGRDTAREALVEAFREEAVRLARDGELEQVETLSQERRAFLDSGDLPGSPAMAGAREEYEEALARLGREAAERLGPAQDAMTRAGSFDAALLVADAREALIARPTATVSELALLGREGLAFAVAKQRFR